MTENKGKWASRHRKIEKSGYQAAAKMISFPRRWHGGMISANQEAIWGMSVQNAVKLSKSEVWVVGENNSSENVAILYDCVEFEDCLGNVGLD